MSTADIYFNPIWDVRMTDTSLRDGSGRSRTVTRTSIPRARASNAWRCAQIPQAGSSGRG